MSSVVRICWNLIGPQLQRRYNCAVESGAPWQIPWFIWRRLPSGAWWSLNQHLLRRGEELAFGRMKTDEILRFFVPGNYDPDSWAATPATRLVLWNAVNQVKPSCIVEFGSGISTSIFAKYAEFAYQQHSRCVRIVSIDHDINWLSQTRESLAMSGLAQYVNLYHAPLTLCSDGISEIKAYDPRIVQDAIGPDKVDLCFIDGPPGFVGRDGGLPLIAPHLSTQAIVFMDDAARAGEQLIANKWRRMYPSQIKSLRCVLTSRGLLRIRFRQNSKQSPAELYCATELESCTRQQCLS